MTTKVPDSIPGVDDRQLAAVVGLFPELPNIGAELPARFAQAVRALVESARKRSGPTRAKKILPSLLWWIIHAESESSTAPFRLPIQSRKMSHCWDACFCQSRFIVWPFHDIADKIERDP